MTLPVASGRRAAHAVDRTRNVGLVSARRTAPGAARGRPYSRRSKGPGSIKIRTCKGAPGHLGQAQPGHRGRLPQVTGRNDRYGRRTMHAPPQKSHVLNRPQTPVIIRDPSFAPPMNTSSSPPGPSPGREVRAQALRRPSKHQPPEVALRGRRDEIEPSTSASTRAESRGGAARWQALGAWR